MEALIVAVKIFATLLIFPFSIFCLGFFLSRLRPFKRKESKPFSATNNHKRADISTFEETTAHEIVSKRYYYDIPFEENEAAKMRGARWDSAQGQWYVVGKKVDASFSKWVESISKRTAPILQSKGSDDIDFCLEAGSSSFGDGESWETGAETAGPYFAHSIMTNHELDNYRRLVAVAAPLSLCVFPKVRLLDLIEPHEDNPRAEYRLLRYIWAKHVDFVVWSPENEQVLCVLELDDFTHKLESRKRRDQFVERVLIEAGYIYLHYSTFYEDRMRHKLKKLQMQSNTK